MPPVAAAAVAIFSTVTAAVTAVGATVVAFGITVKTLAIAALAISGLAAVFTLASGFPKPGSTGQQLTVKHDPNAGVPVAFGRTAVGGFKTYMRSGGGSKNPYLYSIQTLSAGGPIESIEGCLASDLLINFSGNPLTGLRTVTSVSGQPSGSKLYKNKMRQLWSLGPVTGATSINSRSGVTVPETTSNTKFTGLAHVLTVLESDQDAFANGQPSNVFIIKGQKLYDPRKDSTYPGGVGTHRRDDPSTWTFSENPSLAAIHWARGRWTTDGKRLYGIGAPWSDIDLPTFVAGANLDDANGWKVGGSVTTADDKYAVFCSILQAGGGIPLQRAGQFSALYNAPKASVFTITASDVVGDVEINTSTPYRDRFNTVQPVSREESNFWVMMPGEIVSEATYVAEDGGEVKTREVEFPLVQNTAQAHQLAVYEMINSREFLTCRLTGGPKLIGVRVGDAVTVNLPDAGITNQKMIAQERSIDQASLTVKLILRADMGDAKHAYALGQSQVPPQTPTLDTFDPTDPDAPGVLAWSITDTAVTTTRGVSVPAIVINGNNDDPYTASILTEYRRFGSSIWTLGPSGPKTTTRFEITGLAAGVQYEAAVSYRTVRGILSPRLLLSPVTAGASIGTGLIDNSVDWFGNVITNVPDSITNFDNGLIWANNVTTGGGVNVAQLLSDSANTVAALDAELSNAITLSNGVLTGIVAQATTYRDQAQVQANAAFNAAQMAVANAITGNVAANYAASNAIRAKTQADYAGANASTAQQQASYAGANAALALISSNTAASLAGNAGVSATTAATQASYSTANAATAFTQSGLATGYAANANVARGQAVTNATITALQAGYSTANAAAAQDAKNLAVIYQGQATTSAGIASTQAGYVTSNAAAANAAAVLTVGYRDAALANAAASNVARVQAQTNATVASTQAGFATANAALAQAQSGLAADYAGQAGSNAVSAQAQANIATTQAAYSADNAATASEQRILSAGFASQAQANATLAQTRAGYALSNAAIATTQASYATANASIANDERLLSATFAGYSQANATLAGTRATWAQTNATVATNQAAYSTANAAFARANAILAAGYRDDAESAASISTQQASYAQANAAAASAQTILTASLSLDSINLNPTFTNWPTATAIPPGFTQYGTTGTLSRVAGISISGPYASRQVSSGTDNIGLNQIVTGVPVGGEWVVIEAEVKLISGSLVGAGLYLLPETTSGANLNPAILFPFNTTADSSGVAPGAGAAGRTYRWAVLADARRATAAQYNLYGMTRYSGFTPAAAATMEWQKLSVRSATSAEIELATARDGAATLSARIDSTDAAIVTSNSAVSSRVTTLSSTVGTHTSQITTINSTASTLSGRVDAKVGVILDVNGNVSGFSSTNDGTFSTFDVVATKFRVSSGATSIAPFTVSGSTITLTGSVVVNGSLIVNGSVVTAKIDSDAVTQTVSTNGSSGSMNRFNKVTTVSQNINGVLSTSACAVFWSCNFRIRGGDLTQIQYEMVRAANGGGATGGTVAIAAGIIDLGSIGIEYYSGPAILRYVDVPPTAGNYTYFVRVWSDINSAPVVQVYRDASIEVVERKK